MTFTVVVAEPTDDMHPTIADIGDSATLSMKPSTINGLDLAAIRAETHCPACSRRHT